MPNSWKGGCPFHESESTKFTAEMLIVANYVERLEHDPMAFPETIRSAIKHIPFVERKSNGLPRVCQKCTGVNGTTIYKPDRTHHCSICGECVLKMDHHCLWLGNCIGFYNHKYFILFLFYAVLSSLVVCISMFNRLVFAFRPVWDLKAFFASDFFVIVGYGAALFIVICIGIFLGFHIQLILGGTTTIERKEKLESRDPVVAHKAKLCFMKYSHDGLYRNWCQVFGNNPALWLFPDSREADNSDGTYVDWDSFDFVHPDLAQAVEWITHFHANDLNEEHAGGKDHEVYMKSSKQK